MSAAVAPSIYEEDHPLCKMVDIEAQKGIIRTITVQPFEYFAGTSAGVFSFVYYYKPTDAPGSSPADFLETTWYKGLKTYLDFVHDPAGTVARGQAEQAQLFDFISNPENAATVEFPEGYRKMVNRDTAGNIPSADFQPMFEQAKSMPPLSAEEAQRFSNWSIVIYTDTSTQALLRSVFPFSQYPRLCIAVVMWPMYSLEGGICEYTILRCLRYQAMELFPNSTVFVRDADTIFVHALQYIDTTPNYIAYLMMWWELEFLKPWQNQAGYVKDPAVKPYKWTGILIGTMTNYVAPWHRNVPIPVPIAKGVDVPLRLQMNDAKNVVFKEAKGLFAGFVNITKDDPTMKKLLWNRCVDFLTKRYFIAVSEGRRIISDTFCRGITGHAIGKDERLLIFVFPSSFRLHVQYYYIEYSAASQSTPAFINAPWWPIGLRKRGEKQIVQFNHLLTPYYNRGVQNTFVKTINEELGDEQREVYNKYYTYTKEFNENKVQPFIKTSLEGCNLDVAADDLFLKQADILSPDELASKLSDPIPNLNALRATVKAKAASGGKRYTKTQKKSRKSK
jgi:hypothetical protein